MCISIPGRVVALTGERAEVDVLGARRRVSSALYPDVRVGQYVLMNAGLIVELLPEDEAHATLALLAELMALDEAPAQPSATPAVPPELRQLADRTRPGDET